MLQDQVRYNLRLTTGSAYFDIDETTGIISTRANLFRTVDSYIDVSTWYCPFLNEPISLPTQR